MTLSARVWYSATPPASSFESLSSADSASGVAGRRERRAAVALDYDHQSIGPTMKTEVVRRTFLLLATRDGDESRIFSSAKARVSADRFRLERLVPADGGILECSESTSVTEFGPVSM